MNAGDTALVTTFNASGNEPSVGDYYYISYTTEKNASDFALKIFDNTGDAYTQYGVPTPENRLSWQSVCSLRMAETSSPASRFPSRPV
jgi:uncharacterized protein with WD repeat